jgi:sulfite exporter TauE/SafE
MASELISSEIAILCLTALSIGVLHTILGPDHYLPFVAMSKAGGWSARKTLGVTVACGVGHVASSVAIGAAGLLLGIAAMQLETLEGFRGDLAGWLLISFGLAYAAWGVMRDLRDMPYRHRHAASHSHAANDVVAPAAVWTPWTAFLVFVFGPCEPLIPLLMYPAAKASSGAVAVVAAAFALATVVTMVAAVMAMRYGLSFVQVPTLGRFGHAMAGLAILACGVLVKIGL